MCEIINAVADPGFPRLQAEGAGAGTTQRGRVNLLFGRMFAANLMKMKEIRLGAACL